jgi:capsular polysaccharide biosynthesis protein
MATARVIVSPAGASNCLTLLAPMGAKVIELWPPVKIFGMFNGIVTASLFNQEYYRLFGNVPGKNAEILSNYMIGIEKLLEVVRD